MNNRRRTYKIDSDPYSTLGSAGPIFSIGNNSSANSISVFNGLTESKLTTGLTSYSAQSLASDMNGYIYINYQKSSSNEVYRAKWNGSSFSTFSKVHTIDSGSYYYLCSNAYEVRFGDYSSKGLTDSVFSYSYRYPYLDRYMVAWSSSAYIDGYNYVPVMYIRNSVTNVTKRIIFNSKYKGSNILPSVVSSPYMDRILFVYNSGNYVELLEYMGDPEELTDLGSIEFTKVTSSSHTPYRGQLQRFESICIDKDNIYLGFIEYDSLVSSRPYFCRIYVINKDHHSSRKIIPNNGILDMSGTNTSVGNPHSHVVSDSYSLIFTDSISTSYGNTGVGLISDLGSFDVTVSQMTSLFTSTQSVGYFHIPIWRYNIQI